MNSRVTSLLSTMLLDILQKGCLALLLTVSEDGYPSIVYTWMVALYSTTIHFGADHSSATLANLEREGRASLQIIAPENLLFLIKGTTHQIRPQIEAAPFNMSRLGVTVQPLEYKWVSERRQEMLAMERTVYNEMHTWSG